VSFDETVMYCGAPALCGIKPSCLFSIRRSMYEKEKIREWSRLFKKTGRYIIALPKQDERMLVFIYDKCLLEKHCTSCCVKKYLVEKKYPVESGFYAVLSELLHRLAGEGMFPHEVGIFLGYPLEDVKAFEVMSGRACRYSGFWKVYGNVGSAVKQMEVYKSCCTLCSTLVRNGMTVPSAVKIYSRSQSWGCRGNNEKRSALQKV
jgi:hypothetical protein